MKNVIVSPALLRFSLKLTCCNTLGSVSSVCCLLKNILHLSENFLCNKDIQVNNQLRNHLLDQQPFLKYFHTILYYF